MQTLARALEPIRVLLVEDEFLISDWVAEWLTEHGFAVIAASNATEGLHHLQSSVVDVLFTDINLPGVMDGLALARRAREIAPDLGVVYTSGRTNGIEPRLRVPRSAFLAKPYAPAAVAQLLAEAVRAADKVPA
jgi:CheY-like chemotaxis protein